MKSQSYRDFVAKRLVELFPKLGQEILEKVLEVGQLKAIERGELVIKEGAQDKSVFILLSGKLVVTKSDEDTGKELLLNTINTGEFFGEMALLGDAARSTNVRSSRISLLAEIRGEDFQDLLDAYPTLYRALSQTLIQRLSKANRGQKGKIQRKTVGIVPLEGLNETFLKDLTQAVKTFCTTAVLDYETWREIENESQEMAQQKLGEHELENDLVFYLGKAGNLKWNKVVAGQSDMVLFLSEGSNLELDRAIWDDLEKQQSLGRAKRGVIFIHSKPIEDSASQFLNTLNADFHFHVQDKHSVYRLARFLTDRSVKLVLGGGGARGFAHLGVWRALKELQIPVDFVGGTSIGSIIGGGMALGYSLEEFLGMCKKAFVEQNPLNDYQFPLVSLIRGRKLDKLLQKNFGNVEIENLPLPYFCVAADLSKAETRVIKTGQLWKAIRASISLPTILPPSVKNNSLLVDGGIVDNLPGAVMNQMAVGTCIGVDLSRIKERRLDYDQVPNNWVLFRDRFRKRKRFKVPNIFQIIMSTLTLASNEKRIAHRDHFDVYLEPPVSSFGFLKWKDFEKIVQAGYDYSYPILEEWKRKNLNLTPNL